ncbi:MAG: hypothetical protein ABIH67_01940 [Candidatus Uhrbacteria bacterium]
MSKKIRRRVLHFATHPGQWFTHPAKKHYHKKYHGRYKYARALFVFDMFLLGLMFGLGIFALILAFYRPATITDKVLFEATVAPASIVSGASSTLTIHWTNTTGQELREATLLLGYPEHFLLQEVISEKYLVKENRIEIGSIPVDGTGMVRIRGVMFGDVGGQQTFRSILTFQFGEENEVAQKISYHSFTPVSSTLKLELDLPERLVGYQEVAGTITYRNTGEIDYPQISIEPEWPDGYILIQATQPMVNSAFLLPALSAGTEGTMEFSGRLDTADESVTFIFHPSFTFGNILYQQESLTQTSPLIPPPVSISHNVDSSSLHPGGTAEFQIRYENISDYSVSDIQIQIETDSPFFLESDLESQVVKITELAPGQVGEDTIMLPLRSSIMQSETEIYENLEATTRATASFTLGDGTPQRVLSYGQEITTPITSPIVLDSFGRYSTAQGDQLGRGPLPPYVGAETKYWVFINLTGTTNALENIEITAELPDNIRFTGKQTVSVGNSIEHDAGTIRWTSDQIDPTFAPIAPIVGLAFEVGITPNEEQVGTAPTLLENIQITGTDSVTGAFISATGPVVTTDLPHDTMAANQSIVQK